MNVEEKRDGEPLWEEVLFYRCDMRRHFGGDLINIWTTIRPLHDRAATEEQVRLCAKQMAEWIISNKFSFGQSDAFQIVVAWTLDVRTGSRQIVKTGGDWSTIAKLAAHPLSIEFRRYWDTGIFAPL